MFSIHDFIMTTLHGMVHKYPDFQVREYALNWYAKGKLDETDLQTVEEWLTVVEAEPVVIADAPEEEAPQEESVEETTEEA